MIKCTIGREYALSAHRLMKIPRIALCRDL